MMEQDMQEILFTQEQLAARVQALAEQIRADYAGKSPLVVGVLRGCFVFMADLVRHLDLPLTLDFMSVSSYGAGTESSGLVNIRLDLHEDIAGRDVLLGDLERMLRSIVAIARGQEPPEEVGILSLGEYAGRMSAPHRMDLMISAMTREGAWHCNQKCLHCYAANQPLGAVKELDTDQWLAVIQKCRAAGIPQLTFTGGEPTMRNDLVSLVHAAQWFVTRLNTNGRLLTPELCRRPPVDSFLFFLYYTIVPPAISTSIPQNLKIFLSC